MTTALALLKVALRLNLAVDKRQKMEDIRSVAAGFDRHGMPPTASNPDLWPFDLKTGVRVASKVGNLLSKFGHARPFRSGIIRYVRDGRTYRQTDGETDGQKQRLLPLPTVGGITRQDNEPILGYISINQSIKMFICKAPLKQCSQRRLLEVCTLKKPCL